MPTETDVLSTRVAERLLERNRISRQFFPREAPRLARTCQQMAERFQQGGRLLAFGRGPYATDAQHVSVEFVHPVIVGKRALPALDLSAVFPGGLQALLQPEDMVMGFAPPSGDSQVETALAAARRRGTLTFSLPGETGDYAVEAPSDDPFIHQEMIEVLYHTLWETVHVFLEHRERGHDVGEAGFLYPYLGADKQDTGDIVDEVASSIVEKAQEDERLREQAARELSPAIADAAVAIHERLQRGGRLFLFGNGGSATDANDFAVDCVAPPEGYRPIPALSLSLEPANISAIANDIGPEAIFLRQLVAHAGPEDVAVAFTTSGSSKNVLAALKEARKQRLLTVALAGYDGGDIARDGQVDHALVVSCDYIPRIQEIHASIYHVMRELLDALSDDLA